MKGDDDLAENHPIPIMMGWLFSFLPRAWLQHALLVQWRSTLTYGEKARLDYWGATGNADHHEWQWAARIKKAPADDAR